MRRTRRVWEAPGVASPGMRAGLRPQSPGDAGEASEPSDMSSLQAVHRSELAQTGPPGSRRGPSGVGAGPVAPTYLQVAEGQAGAPATITPALVVDTVQDGEAVQPVAREGAQRTEQPGEQMVCGDPGVQTHRRAQRLPGWASAGTLRPLLSPRKEAVAPMATPGSEPLRLWTAQAREGLSP